MPVFSTASKEPRPIRLKEATREWAWESMHGKYGEEAMRSPYVRLDDIENFELLTDTEKYDQAIRRIAMEAPVRICPEEKVCGAATLGNAILHHVPAYYRDERVFPSVSHLTIRYDRVLREGLDVYGKEIEMRLADDGLTNRQKEFLHSLLMVIESIRIWHGRYMEAAKDKRPDLCRLLSRVPFSPAQNFHEALQSLWFIFSFVRLCGNWPGIGRLDWMLGDYLERDLRDGVLSRDEARELLASFFIKGCEWIREEPPASSGDAQHYQNIVLAGVDENGNEIANEVTFLTLEVVEELAISDFPITVRLNSRSSRKLKDKVARVMRHGGGIVAVYNEDLILRALSRLGYPLQDARSFANDGCWEVQVPGKTRFDYMPFDALQILNRVLGLDADAEIPSFGSAEEVYAAFRAALEEEVGTLYRRYVSEAFECVDGVWQANPNAAGGCIPTSVVSLFEDGCIESAHSYQDCGTRYTVRSPHIGGAPDVADSLYAIQKAVFEENKISFPDLIRTLRNNWKDQEMLRLYVRNRYVYYGNDSEEADRWHTRVLNDFADIVERCGSRKETPVIFIPGVSTFGRQIDWLPKRCATAFGYKRGEILSGNDSPVPGTDTNGATSIIKSCCKADLARQSCGAALDIRIFPESLDGENGIAALCGLMDGFLSMGGFFMQLDSVDTQTLREAQKDPWKYKTLSVRVSGWNARFVTLSPEWQNMIIERSSQNLGERR